MSPLSGTIHVEDTSIMLWLPIIFTALPAAYIMWKSVYNLYFHPLRSFPGPKSNAISSIPFVRILLSGRSSQRILKLHETYGTIVRTAPNELSFLDPSAWNDIMGHRQHGKLEMSKDSIFYNNSHFGAASIIVSDRDDHTRFRRILSHAFSEKSMREQESLIRGYVDLLIERVKSNCAEGTKPLNMVSWYNWTTFDIIGDLAFGEPFNCLRDSSYHPWVSMIFEQVKAGAYLQCTRRFAVIQRLTQLCIPASLIRAREFHIQMTKEKVSKRLAMETQRPDFMTYILQKDGKMGMSVPEKVANSSVLVIAGSETTATALSGATYHLLRNPAVLAKLTAEVRSTFQSEEEINLLSVGGLKYMLACLEETLRIYPPVPTALPRAVPQGGEIISGKMVPGGTVVSIPQWAMYRSPHNFTEPNSFIPERFLGDPRFHSDCKAALQPFHVGPRNCIGKNLAIAEMRLILAKIIFNFDMKLAEDSQNWEHDQHMYLLWEKGPLNVYLTPVERQ